MIWDKQFGFLKETLVAPANRKEIIIGRTLGDSLAVVFQNLIILNVPACPRLNPYGVVPAVLYGLLLVLGFASISITLSTKISSMEGFQMIVNLITMPLLFLSGIFYQST